MPCRAPVLDAALQDKSAVRRDEDDTRAQERCGGPASRSLNEAGQNRAPQFFVGQTVGVQVTC